MDRSKLLLAGVTDGLGDCPIHQRDATSSR